MKVSNSKYKDIESVVLENELLRVEIVPAAGARTASIVYKPKDEELLWQNPSEAHGPVVYAQSFSAGEKAGFDEMFPTINECLYPDFPWRGAEMPDHGEVWALPWCCRTEADSVELAVQGVRLPYRLTKKLRLEGPVLKAVYRAENLSPFRMPYLYAAHPLFNINPGDRVIVPDNLTSVINAAVSDRLPEYGKEYPWTVSDLAVVPAKNAAGYQKYYFKGINTEGWSALRREQAGVEIKMSVSADRLPYLGIWVNEGGWDNQYNLALEPASAPMDDLTAARAWGQESVLEVNEVREWELDIEVNGV